VIVGSRERGDGREDGAEVAAGDWAVVVGDMYFVLPAAWRLSGIVSSLVAVLLVAVEL